MTVYPLGSSNSLSRLPLTPSNLSSQYPKPSGAVTWPERTSLVSGFQAMMALARAPPADVPTRRIACRAPLRCSGVKEPRIAWR